MMLSSLQGFREFFYAENTATDYDRGLTELKRLAQCHHVLVYRTNQSDAMEYVNAGKPLRNVQEAELTTALVQEMLPNKDDALVFALIPKRWFKQMGRVPDVKERIEEMLPLRDHRSELPNHHIWGVFTKLNEKLDKVVEPGLFYKNSNYHGHDKLFELWAKDNLPKKVEIAVPLDKCPKVSGPHTAYHGYPTFHAYIDRQA